MLELSERFHMTKGDMLERMSSEELSQRMALDMIRQKEREQAKRMAKAKRRLR